MKLLRYRIVSGAMLELSDSESSPALVRACASGLLLNNPPAFRATFPAPGQFNGFIKAAMHAAQAGDEGGYVQEEGGPTPPADTRQRQPGVEDDSSDLRWRGRKLLQLRNRKLLNYSEVVERMFTEGPRGLRVMEPRAAPPLSLVTASPGSMVLPEELLDDETEEEEGDGDHGQTCPYKYLLAALYRRFIAAFNITPGTDAMNQPTGSGLRVSASDRNLLRLVRRVFRSTRPDFRPGLDMAEGGNAFRAWSHAHILGLDHLRTDNYVLPNNQAAWLTDDSTILTSLALRDGILSRAERLTFRSRSRRFRSEDSTALFARPARRRSRPSWVAQKRG